MPQSNIFLSECTHCLYMYFAWTVTVSASPIYISYKAIANCYLENIQETNNCVIIVSHMC